MARITGIGGVFFKSRNDNAALAAWYQKHLGIPLESWGGAVLKWPDDTGRGQGAHRVACRRKGKPVVRPSDSSFMINYRVDDLGQMIEQLRAPGSKSSRVPNRMKTGSSHGSWTLTGTRWSCGAMIWDEKNKSA